MSLSTRLSRRVVMSFVSGALLVSLAAGGALAQSASPLDEPSVPVAQPTMDPGDGAVPAIPNPDIVDPLPAPWQRIEVAPDGKTLTVYFMNGAAGCNGLKDVEVSVVDGVTTVTVLTGLTPEAMFTTCVAGLFLYKTPVVLDAPILAGGGA